MTNATYKGNAAEPVELAPLDPGGSVTGDTTEIVEYSIDWSDRITPATISSSSWFITGKAQQPAATGLGPSVSGSITSLFLEATTGATGSQVVVTNTVALSTGERLSRSFKFTLKTR